MKKISVVAALVLCAALFGSCQNPLDFFTNSLGGDWARDPGTITVTSKNVNALLKESRGDTKASKGILEKIAAELKGNPDPDPVLQAAAVTAANQAAGLGELVLGNISTVLDSIDSEGGEGASEDTFKTLLEDIEKKAKENEIGK
ncbi:MAG: hypothetical protein LBF63_06695, partial [Treponema sp.]|nr:hypothetical protein [Treponema sp.]